MNHKRLFTLAIVGLFIAHLAEPRLQAAAGPTGKIAYGADLKLWIYDTCSQQRTEVPLTPGTNYRDPAFPDWRPDGQWLCFYWGADLNRQIFVVRPDGTGQQIITDGNGDYAGDPVFSPDGKRVACSTVYGNVRLIDLVETDGKLLPANRQTLPVVLTMLTWAPDGRKLAGTDWGLSYNSSVYVYDLDTGLLTKIAQPGPGEAFQWPAWSPDGTKIALAKRGQPDIGDIWLMNADGSGLANLTPDWAESGETYPTWTADGQFIVFSSDRSGNVDVWAMRPDGTGRVNLTDSPGINENLPRMWAPVYDSRVFLGSGTLAGQAINADQPEICVSPGEAIRGSFTVQVHNAYAAASITPLAATPTWGEPSNSFWCVNDWVPTGDTTQTVSVDLKAPTEPGTYYIAVAMAGTYDCAQIMSGTHPSQPADWEHGCKVALLPPDKFEAAIKEGWVSSCWYLQGQTVPCAYAMTAVRVVVPAYDSRLFLGSGTLAGQAITPERPEIRVSPGEAIQGCFTVQVHNAYAAASITPLAATPTWGEPSTSFWCVNDWVPTGDTTQKVCVDLKAPTEPGTYYIAVAMAGTYDCAQIMSGTHPTQPADWEHGCKVALLPADKFETAMKQGWVPTCWYLQGQTVPSAYAMTAVRVVVADPLLSLKWYAGITIKGTLGKTYVVEARDVLDTNRWILQTNLTLAVPIQEWIDMSSGTNSPSRFYRVRLQ